jgi:succinate dehydrogenase/fumarate reductase flavoprotein subunit
MRSAPGCVGTVAGLATDERARVLGGDDRPIPGLSAVGNDEASVMGGHYPAGGVTIGPAVTFGYIADRALASVAEGTLRRRCSEDDGEFAEPA